MPTTTVKSIGSGGGRDYSTIQAWEDACPANLVTADEVWRGECYNDSEFSSASSITISGTTTDATRYLWLTTATGQSFRDHADKATNPLRYDQAKGVGIKCTGTYTSAIAITQAYLRISGLQVTSSASSTYGAAISYSGTGSDSNGLIVEDCILESFTFHGYQGTGQIIRNSLLVVRDGSNIDTLFYARFGSLSLYNCTLVATETAVTKAFAGSSTITLLKNVAVFGDGLTTMVSGPTLTTATTCMTNLASPPTGFSTVTFADQFEVVTDATRDFRVKAGADLIDGGTTETTHAAADIIGTARPSGSAYDVGAFELQAGGGIAIPVLMVQYKQRGQ
jgi:hypothetical protein